MERIRLDMIAFDAGTQIRESISESVVSEYAERMTEGVEFPPVVLFHDGTRYFLADGFHRYMASKRLAFVDIAATVQAGTKDDALWFALGANKANGHRMTEGDKRHAVRLALQMWPTRLHTDIAAQVGCSESLVSKESSKLNSELGTQVITGRALVNHGKREAVQRLVKSGGLSADAIASTAGVSKSFVSKVRAEMGEPCYDRTREGVVRRVSRMRQMAADGYTSVQIADAVGLTVDGCRNTLKREGIEVTADKVTRGTHRHDSNRIVERIVIDAENLIEGVNLIDFDDIDKDRLAEWLNSLSRSRDQLGAFIRRLMKEQQKHGEAA